MKFRFAIAAVAASVLASCSGKENEEPVVLPFEEKTELEIAVSGTATKTTQDESQINTLQVFIFGGDGMLESSETAEGKSALTVDVFPGIKTIHALVNAPEINDVTDYSDFCSNISYLYENNPENFVMEGWGTDEIGGRNKKITLEVIRMAAKVSLVSVYNDLSENYRDMDLVLKNAYLINVAGDRQYSGEGYEIPAPTEWYNRRAYSSDDGLEQFTYASYNSEYLDYTWESSYTHTFYCYPNPTAEDSSDEEWCPRFTRLVIEAELGGTTYYYPISIPDIEQNCEYVVSLTITRPGSDDPDVPFSSDAAEVQIEVADWYDGGQITEVI